MAENITPEVGMGVTYAVGSDRYAATIVEVLIFKSGERKGQVRGVVIQDDKAIVTSGSEQDGSAQYRYEPQPNAVKETFLWNAQAGRFIRHGYCRLGLGHRSFYRNPSF
jgi:hypothetical protein